MSGEIEMRKARVYFTFGRFQPPTKGHGVLVKALEDKAGEADVYAFVSSSRNDVGKLMSSKKFRGKMAQFESDPTYEYEFNDKNENPLDVGTKVSFLRKMFPTSPVRFINTTEVGATNVNKAIGALRGAGYEDIRMIVGSDRVAAFKKFIKDIPIEAAGGERILSGEATANVRTISASKMRRAAMRGNTRKFSAGIQTGALKNSDIEELMAKIRAGVGMEGGQRRHRAKSKTRKQKWGF